jgi:hypothetical protein
VATRQKARAALPRVEAQRSRLAGAAMGCRPAARARPSDRPEAGRVALFRGRAAQDRDRSAQGLGPVFEADDARAAARVGAAYAIVADRQDEGAVTAVHAHVDDRGPGVLCHVGNRLRGDVISGRLNAFREPRAQIQVGFNRHRGSAGQRFERRSEPGLGQNGRVNALRDLPQLVQRGPQTLGQQRQRAPDLVHGLGVIISMVRPSARARPGAAEYRRAGPAPAASTPWGGPPRAARPRTALLRLYCC